MSKHFLSDFQILLLQQSFNPWHATVADWFMAAGGFATVITLLYLIWSSKGQQKTMNEFKDLFKQLEVQNEIMRQGNQLTSQQIEIMRASQFKDAANSVASSELLELEKEKFRLAKLPRFDSSGGLSSPEAFEVTLANYGTGRARIEDIILIEGQVELRPIQLPTFVGPGGNLNIYGLPKPGQNGNFVRFKMTIKYSDDIGHKYEVNVVRAMQAVRVGEPQLIKS